MNFSTNKKKLIIGMAGCICLLVSVAMTLPGCGDSDSDGIDNTAKASISDDNAETLFKGVLLGSEFPAIPPTGSDGIPQNSARTNFAKMKQQVENISSTAGKDSKDSENGTINGSCGGSLDLSGTSNENDGVLNADYNNFCVYSADVDQNVTYNGSVNITFKNIADSSGTEIINVEIEYINTSMSYPGFSITLNGKASITLSSFGSIECNYNMTILDTVLNQTTIYKNYNFIISASDNTLTFSGHYSHPDFGYVQISTPELITSPSPGVLNGRLHIEGAETDSGNTSSADLILNGTSATLEIDIDGDGTVDFTEIISV